MGMTEKKAPLEAINNIYNEFPSFTDIFDEDSFYIFVFCFTLCTILGAVVLSRFITLKERDL